MSASELQRLLGITLLASVISCSSADLAMRKAAPARSCSSDDDCSIARGETCVRIDGQSVDASGEKDGICILRGSMSVKQVYLEIQPVDQAVNVQLGPFALDEQNLQLKVPMPIDVHGVVHDEASTSTLIPQASIHFRSIPLIPGRSQSFETTTSNENPEQAGHFIRRLPQGAYTVTIQPPDNFGLPVPPQRIQNLRIDDGTGDLALPVANPNYLIYPKGVLQVQSGTQVEPLAGMGVRAVELARDGTAVSGATSLSRTVSSDASGSFQLGLLPLPVEKDTGPSALRLQVGPFQSNILFPTFWDLPLKVETKQDSSPPSTVFTLAPLELPGSLVTVRGSVIDPNGAPVSGARVSFVTTTDARTASGRFSFNNTTLSRNDGTFELQLYPADYTAIAQPPADPAGDVPTNMGLCGVTQSGSGIPVRVDSAGGVPFGQVTLACEQQRWIDGIVLNRQRSLVSGATVEAFRRPTAEFPTGMKFQTKSLADGSFSLPVVTGTYDLLIRPPDALKLPFRWVRGFEVGAEELGYSQGFELDDPFELFGQVIDDSSGQAVQATIEAFVVVDESISLRIGRSASNSNGQYRLVLPATSTETSSIRPASVR
jgi:hypothetical protein